MPSKSVIDQFQLGKQKKAKQLGFLVLFRTLMSEHEYPAQKHALQFTFTAKQVTRIQAAHPADNS